MKLSVFSILSFSLLMQICLLSTVVALESNQNYTYTLDSSIEIALEKNWSLKAQEEKQQQALDLKNQAKADFLPQLKTQYAYTRVNDADGLSYDTENNFKWRTGITQSIFTGFKLTSAYRSAKLGIDLARLNLELSRLDLALQVKAAYFNILAFDKTVVVFEKEVTFLSSKVELVNQFYQAEMIPINDVLKAKLELANSQQNLVEAENQAKQARSAFNILLAQPVNAQVDVEDILRYYPEKIEFQPTVEKALKQRPEIRQIDIHIQQAEQHVKLAKSDYYPAVNLSCDFVKEGDQANVSGSPYHDGDRWEGTMLVSWSLWDWGKRDHAVSEKRSIINELKKTRHALKENISHDINAAQLDLATAEQNISTTQKAVRQGEENLRVNEENYRVQMVTITDLLDAQALLTQARVNYYKALYRHNAARARLLRAMGTY
nr:TolC family protein [uncultured Desulfobacter sp.]